MGDYQFLHSVLDRSVAQACEESSMLLGQEFRGEQDDCININRISYFGDTDDPMMVAVVESREDYPGSLYMVFTLRDAILLSGLMLGIPPARISEKRRLAILESDDVDAFGEIMNQIIGSFNSIFQPAFPKKTHLKLLSHRKFVPGVDEMTDAEPIPDGDYHLCRYRLVIPGHEMDRLDIFITASLAALLDPPAVAAASAPAESEAGGEVVHEVSGDGHSSSPDPAIVVIDDDESDRALFADALSKIGASVLTVPSGSDLRPIFSDHDVRLVVIGGDRPDDHHFSLCIKVSSLQQGGRTVPLVMAAREWTRSSVLKAVKYGARDIIMKPAGQEEIVERISRQLASQ